MKSHDITGWLKESMGGGHNDSNRGTYFVDPANQQNQDVDSVMKSHDITGWLKDLLGDSLSNEVGTGKTSHERGMMKLHDLTGWLKVVQSYHTTGVSEMEYYKEARQQSLGRIDHNSFVMI
jgi:hypothetical protein